MPKYKKRKDGRYAAQVTVGVDPKSGKIQKKTVYALTIAELESKKAHLLHDLQNGTYANDKGLTVAKYANQWLRVSMSGKSQASKDRYAGLIKNHMKYIGGLKLAQLRKSDVLVELNDLEDKKETQRLLLTCIRQIINAAIDDGLISRDVTRNIKLAPAPAREEKEPLSSRELEAIQAADLDMRQRCFINVLLYTGMRKGEAFALRKADIDLRAGEIRVTHSVTYIDNEPVIKMPKTRAGIRSVPILAELRQILQEYMKTCPMYLFGDPESGKLLTAGQARSFWETIYRKISDAAGCIRKTSDQKKVIYVTDPMKGLTCHRFRHNFASILYYAGVDVKDAARILGHENINITLQIYTHLDQEKSASAEKIEQYLKKAGPAF